MASKTDFPGVALITGAASGIGFAVARAFATAGCERLILIDLNPSGLSSAHKELTTLHPSLQALTYTVDISQENAMSSALSDAMTKPSFNRLDYCVNCAGMNGINAGHAPTNTTETSIEYFDKINAVNYRGTWMANRAFLGVMMKQECLPSLDGREQRGAIVNLSSGLGVIAMPRNPVYSASKAAIIAMTRSDAVDYSEHKIRINCVCPGLIDTPMTSAMGDDPAAMKWVVDSTPLKRMGKPEEIADCCLFLCSTKASWVQGQSLIADGGIVLL